MSSKDVFAKPKLRKHRRAARRIFARRAAVSSSFKVAGIDDILTISATIVNMFRYDNSANAVKAHAFSLRVRVAFGRLAPSRSRPGELRGMSNGCQRPNPIPTRTL